MWAASTRIFWAVAVTAVCIIAVVVDAKPFGAANCVPGGNAIRAAGPRHVGSRRNENSTLADRETTFAVSGTNVVGGESFPVGTSLAWTLAANGVSNWMRGVLIRVQHSGGDGVTLEARRLKDNELCTGVGIVGLTHRSPLPKRQIQGTLRLDATGNVTVDITIVYRNNRRVSSNGYSQYKFSIV